MKRVFHTWNFWECYPAGFYESKPETGEDQKQCEAIYAELLRDIPEFKKALARVISEWKFSCEHYLSNENMNRIAWLGQAALCISKGIPACFRGGYNKLTKKEQEAADAAALQYLNLWLMNQGEPQIPSVEDAASKTEANLY